MKENQPPSTDQPLDEKQWREFSDAYSSALQKYPLLNRFRLRSLADKLRVNPIVPADEHANKELKDRIEELEKCLAITRNSREFNRNKVLEHANKEVKAGRSFSENEETFLDVLKHNYWAICQPNAHKILAEHSPVSAVKETYEDLIAIYEANFNQPPAPKELEWVKVIDREPEPNTDILTFYCGSIDIVHFHGGNCEFTHWMNKPTPPQH